MHKFAEYFTRDTANRYLNEGKVVLFAAAGADFAGLLKKSLSLI